MQFVRNVSFQSLPGDYKLCYLLHNRIRSKTLQREAEILRRSSSYKVSRHRLESCCQVSRSTPVILTAAQTSTIDFGFFRFMSDLMVAHLVLRHLFTFYPSETQQHLAGLS